MAYAFIELRTLVKLAVGDVDGDRLMKDFLNAAYAAARKLLDVEVVLDPSSASPESIPRDEPVIVLSRHCGPGDSVLVAWLLTFQYRLQVRIVLKAVLRFEPVLDFAGQRGMPVLPGPRRSRPSTDPRSRRFAVRRPGASAVSRRGELQLPRWHAAIAELRSTGRIRAAKRALRRSYTLPPRTGGVTAAVTRSAQRQCPGADPQRLLPRRAGTALVAAAGPSAIARPHRSRAGRATSPTRSSGPMAGTNLDAGRRLGRRPHRSTAPIIGRQHGLTVWLITSQMGSHHLCEARIISPLSINASGVVIRCGDWVCAPLADPSKSCPSTHPARTSSGH